MCSPAVWAAVCKRVIMTVSEIVRDLMTPSPAGKPSWLLAADILSCVLRNAADLIIAVPNMFASQPPSAAEPKQSATIHTIEPEKLD